MANRMARLRRPFVRAQRRLRGSRRSPGQVLLTTIVCALAGFMIVASSIAARGTDLRASRNTDLISLIMSESANNENLSRELATIRSQVEDLSRSSGAGTSLEDEVDVAAQQAGLTAVKGPAVSVTLTDAPAEINPQGVDEDLLVVHQQDIQAVVNAMWQGGAEAMTIQGKRVVSTTGVKCVGNTVVLHGVPYAPPYTIVAIGNQKRLAQALNASEDVTIYKQYVRAYRLGYEQKTIDQVTMPAFQGATDNEYAEPS